MNAQVPEEIQAVILQAMVASRDARLARAREVHRALEKAGLKLRLSVGPHALRGFLAKVDGATDGSVSELIPVPPAVSNAPGSRRTKSPRNLRTKSPRNLRTKSPQGLQTRSWAKRR